MRFIISLLALSVAAKAAVIVPLESRADIKCSTDVRHKITLVKHETQTYTKGWQWHLRAG